MRLRHANWQRAETLLLVLANLAAGDWRIVDAIGAVYLASDRFNLRLDWHVIGVEQAEVVRHLACRYDHFSQLNRASATLSPMTGDGDAGGASRKRDFPHRLYLGWAVIGEYVDGDDRIDAEFHQILQVPNHVDRAGFDIGNILLFQRRINQLARDDAVLARMSFQRRVWLPPGRQHWVSSRICAI